MTRRTHQPNPRSSRTRLRARYRRLSGLGKLQVLAAVYIWAVGIVMLVDLAVYDGALAGDAWLPPSAMAALVLGSAGCALDLIRRPDEADVFARLAPRARRRAYGLVAAFTIVPPILAGLVGWLVFALTAAAPIDARRFWVEVTVAGACVVSYLAPTAWLLWRLWRAEREP